MGKFTGKVKKLTGTQGQARDSNAELLWPTSIWIPLSIPTRPMCHALAGLRKAITLDLASNTWQISDPQGITTFMQHY